MVDLLLGVQEDLGLKCKIFISEFVSDARGQAMADLGADVIK
jgi:diaminopropionate ammonia-lyase